MAWRFDFSPRETHPALGYAVAGDVLTVTHPGGELSYDFAVLGEDEWLLAEDIPGADLWLQGTEVLRAEGRLRLCVKAGLPPGLPFAHPARHPGFVDLDADGPVPLPTDGL